jgi:hypothetical protein
MHACECLHVKGNLCWDYSGPPCAGSKVVTAKIKLLTYYVVNVSDINKFFLKRSTSLQYVSVMLVTESFFVFKLRHIVPLFSYKFIVISRIEGLGILNMFYFEMQ